MAIMKKKVIIFSSIITVFIIAIFILSYAAFSQSSDRSKTGNVPTQITVTKVKKQMVTKTISALGTTVASEFVTLSANVTEIVKSIYFQDGDYVEKGQQIVLLSANEELAKLAKAKAALVNAEKHFNRIFTLSNRNHISQSEHDQAKEEFESAKANVAEIEAMVEDRKIIAPFAGYLGLRQISPGTLVQPGTPIATLDKIEPINVDFTLPARYLSAIKIGQRVIASSAAYPAKEFIGKVAALSSRIATDTRTFTTRATFANQDHLLKPGLLLHLMIVVKNTEELTIPEHASVMRNAQHIVFVLNPDNTVRQQLVKLGQHFKDEIVIKKGLTADETIVVDGGFKLTDGQSVSVKKTRAVKYNVAI